MSADEGRHEPFDVAGRPVLLAALGLAAILVLVGAGQLLLLRHYEQRAAGEGAAPATVVAERMPPEPRLLPDPRRALLALRAEENTLLHRYAWVNRDAGVVRIPIERAIDLLAAPAKGSPK